MAVLLLLALHTSAIASSPGPRTKPPLVSQSPHALAAPPPSEAAASLLARATFGWLNPTLRLGTERALEEADLPVLADRDTARHSTDILEREWRTLGALGASARPRAMGLAMWNSFGGEFRMAGLVKLLSDACQFAAPVLLKRVVNQLQAGVGMRQGLGITLALLLVSVVQAFALRHYFALVFRTGLRVRSAMVGLCYRKLLRISSSARVELSSGELNNLIGLDANRLSDLIPYLHALWFAPLQIVLALSLLYKEVGASLIPGIALIGLMLSANTRIAKRTFRKQSELLGIRDRRMRLVREIVSNIKVVKLQAWELIFESRVKGVRSEEISAMRQLITLRSLLSAIFNSTPTLVAVAILSMHVFLGHSLTLGSAITVLATVNLLRSPLAFLPLVLQQLQEAQLSLGRMQRFLNAEEAEHVGMGNLTHVGFSIDNAVLSWDAHGGTEGVEGAEAPHEELLHAAAPDLGGGDQIVSSPAVFEGEGHDSAGDAHAAGLKDERVSFELRGISLQASAGSLVAIVGPVGSGKSSVLAALTGQLQLRRGAIALRGSIAYTAQRPMILSTTVRDNICFGKPFDEAWYDRVIDACDLRSDLSTLPANDLTVIGEKGLSLSGGQRARVALARAVYADAQVYLLDDPLAALDPRVASRLMENVIGPRGLLKDKVRLLATNHLGVLRDASEVVVMIGGQVVERGTFASLSAPETTAAEADPEGDERPPESPAGVFVRLLTMYQQGQGQQAELSSDGKDYGVPATSEGTAGAEPLDGDLTASNQIGSPEERQVGQVAPEVVRRWFAAAGGLRTISLAALTIVITESFSVGSSWWLTRWGAKEAANSVPYLMGYVAFALASAVLVVVRSVTTLTIGLHAGRRLHDKLLSAVVRSPMSFFDVTPVGRLINGFSTETQTVDVSLPAALQTYGATVCAVLSTLAVVISSSPMFLFFLMPIAYSYHAAQKFYISSSRELKRLESMTRPFILSHVSESLDGLSTIRAYDVSRRFVTEAENRQDRNLRAALLSALANCWLGLRLELVGATIATFVTLLAFRGAGSGVPSAVGRAALSVTLALQVTQTLNWSVRQACELEAQLVSVERLQTLSELPSEPGYDIPARSSTSWPQVGEDAHEAQRGPRGRIEMRRVNLRYRSGLPLVLRDLSVTIEPGEKVGVVGRTGSGKSSLLMALTGLVSMPLREGEILIDGEEISERPLLEHRGSIAVIPQEPTLFEGTIMSNLDPLGQYRPEQLWDALQRVQLTHNVRSLSDPVAEDGINFSAGQRQLICIARALLSRASIVILDEATSAVDVETDALIQRTVRSEFSDATVLTIAHRLNTILDADRIMVLDEGKLVEFGPPKELMGRSRGYFRQLVESTSNL